MPVDDRDGLEILPVVGRAGGGGFLFEGKKDLLLGHAVGLHAGEGPCGRVDLHLPRLEEKGPLPLGHVGEHGLDAHPVDARRQDDPEVAVVAAERGLGFVVHEHGQRRPRGEPPRQRHGGADGGVNLGVDGHAAVFQRERDGRDVGGARKGVGDFEQPLAEFSERRLVGEKRLRLRGAEHGAGEEEDRGEFSARAETHAARAPRIEQHGGEREQQDDARSGEQSLDAERDEDGPHRLRRRDRTVPAEAHRPPSPFGNSGAGLDAGFGVVLEVVAGGFAVRPTAATAALSRRGPGIKARNVWGFVSLPTLNRLRDLRRRNFRIVLQATGVSGKVHLLGERISPADPLQLRIQRLLHLPGEEGHENEDERGDGEPFSPANEAAAPAFGDHALEGERDEEDEPDVTGRAEFVIRKAEREEREQGRTEAPQAEDGEGEDEQEKEIEQRPGGEPVAFNVIRAEEREEPPAGREVERDAQRVGVGLPAGGGECARAAHAAGGFEIDAAGADFHAGRGALRVARDELALAAAAHGAKVLAGRGIEPPDLLHRAGDAVAKGERAPVFIQPPLARDAQPGGPLLAHAALALGEAKGRGGVPAIDRQLAPFVREGRLRDIDRGRAGDLDRAEIRLRAERDEHLGHSGARGFREAELLRVVEAEGAGVERPFARAHLRLHASGVVHRDGDGALDGGELPAFGQDDAEVFLAAFAGDGQLDLRAQPERDAVLEGGVEFDREKVFVGLLGRAVALQPEHALRVPRGRVHGFALEGQREDADGARHREALRDSAPAKRALDPVRARAQTDGRLAVVLGDSERVLARADLQRPGIRPAGERHPRFAENGDAEIEAPARLRDLQREARRPETHTLFPVAENRRAVAILVAPSGPRFPRLERVGDRLVRRARGKGKRRERGEEDETEGAGGERVHRRAGKVGGLSIQCAVFSFQN